MNPDEAAPLVALRALKLGDLLTAVPALRALSRAFPDHELVLATPAWLEPLVRHAALADVVVDTPALRPLDPALHGAALAVNLHGRGPQSTEILQATSPRRLVSFGLPDGPRWRPDEHEVKRWCRLLEESGIPADSTDLHIAPPEIAVPAVAKGATLIHPGAAAEARRWPIERWAAIARSEASYGRSVVVTGSASEADLASAVASAAGLPPAAVLAGDTDLLGLFALVAVADRVVCGDTGVAHVATALGSPSVVLFGPVSPALWGPPASGPHVALWAGRGGDPHGRAADAGLLQISVDDVLGALRTLPPRAATAQAAASATTSSASGSSAGAVSSSRWSCW